MRVRNIDRRLLKTSLEILLDALLRMEAGAIVIGPLFCAHFALRGHEVAFGLFYPLARQLLHRGSCPYRESPSRSNRPRRCDVRIPLKNEPRGPPETQS